MVAVFVADLSVQAYQVAHLIFKLLLLGFDFFDDCSFLSLIELVGVKVLHS